MQLWIFDQHIQLDSARLALLMVRCDATNVSCQQHLSLLQTRVVS
jgi:hypothetical protein